MLLVVVFICTVIVLFTSILRHRSFPLSFSFMNLTNLVFLSAIVIYIAIMGGIAAQKSELLFLSANIQRWIHIQPINLKTLGYVVAIGRMLTPWFLFQTAVALSMKQWIRRNTRPLIIGTGLPTLIFLVIYYPTLFQKLVNLHPIFLTLLVRLSFFWIIALVLASLMILFLEWYEISIPMFKRNFSRIVLAIFCQTLVYMIYASKDPAQIYNLFISEYIDLGVSNYISPSLEGNSWNWLIGIDVVCTLIGCWGIFSYDELRYSEDKEDEILQKKFNSAEMGLSIFAHSIKNQVLSLQVLEKRMDRELSKEEPNWDRLKESEEQIKSITLDMKSRIDEYYKSVNTQQIELRPHDVGEIIRFAGDRFLLKHPEGKVDLVIDSDRKILADPTTLGEALANIMNNGYEAAREFREEPCVSVRVHPERLWMVIVIEDNGPGLSRDQRKKVFQPFYTTKSKNESWGMGLFFTKKVVRQHFGHIKVESTPGEGTSFSIMLPSYDQRVR